MRDLEHCYLDGKESGPSEIKRLFNSPEFIQHIEHLAFELGRTGGFVLNLDIDHDYFEIENSRKLINIEIEKFNKNINKKFHLTYKVGRYPELRLKDLEEK